MEKTAILAITKNGIKIAKELKEKFSSWEVFAPNKFSDGNMSVNWYTDNTSTKIVELFKSNDALVCLFSLGAVVRLISPHLKDKKTDPAVIVIDDKAQFVISTLSGHLGGANKLTNEIADRLGATPVITTAADVNKTIAVDLVDLGLDFFPFPVFAHELSIDLVIEVANVANNGTRLCMLQHELVANVDITGGSHNQVKLP